MNQNQLQTVVQSTQASVRQKSNSRNIVSFITLIMMSIFLVFGMTACDSIPMGNPSVISSVKNGKLSGYPNKTVGDAFDDFLSGPVWQEFTADSGEHVVQVKGKCLYMEETVTLCVQFVLDDDDDTFSLYTVTLNDIPQNRLTQLGLLSAVYDE